MVLNQTASVTELAAAVGLSASLASNYLRSLNARGLLHATRRGVRVEYRIQADPAVPFAPDLSRTLAVTFRQESDPVTFVYRHATAFGHSRRQTILKALSGRELSLEGLARTTAIPLKSLNVHLIKLRTRGYLRTAGGKIHLIPPSAPLPAVLLQWTLKGF